MTKISKLILISAWGVFSISCAAPKKVPITPVPGPKATSASKYMEKPKTIPSGSAVPSIVVTPVPSAPAAQPPPVRVPVVVPFNRFDLEPVTDVE